MADTASLKEFDDLMTGQVDKTDPNGVGKEHRWRKFDFSQPGDDMKQLMQETINTLPSAKIAELADAIGIGGSIDNMRAGLIDALVQHPENWEYQEPEQEETDPAVSISDPAADTLANDDKPQEAAANTENLEVEDNDAIEDDEDPTFIEPSDEEINSFLDKYISEYNDAQRKAGIAEYIVSEEPDALPDRFSQLYESANAIDNAETFTDAGINPDELAADDPRVVSDSTKKNIVRALRHSF